MAAAASSDYHGLPAGRSPVSAAPALLLVVGLALPVALVLLRLRLRGRDGGRKWNLPPGPPGWPVVGNLLQVGRSGKPFIHYVRDLRPRYGPIFTLRMGARTLVVVSSAELAHEALVQKGQVFASRPAENPTRDVFSCRKFTVNSALYGGEWRALRRNMVSGMLSATRLREFRGVRRRAMDRFVARLRAEAEAAGDGAVWVLRNARFAVFCILLSMCFGLELEESEIVNVDAVMKRVLLVLNPRMDDFLPLLAPFFAAQRREAMRVRRLQMDTLVPLIERRRAVLRRDPAAGDDLRTAAPFSYLDSLLELHVEGRRSPPADPELVTLVSELLNGGTDTTATAVEWAVARLIEYPAMQARIRDEIVGRAGGRPVEEADLEGLPFLQAFAKELLRKHPPTYFSLTHAVVEPTTLGGYDIPPGVNVDFYLPPISEDPRLWKNPAAFDPDRFLAGGEDADMMCVSAVRMMPFGAGRRICPGLGMGMTHITLMIARMVQAFRWLPHPDQPGVELDEKVEFTVVMNRTLRAVIRPWGDAVDF